MRIVFAGTPEAAVPALRALAASEHEVALVITRPDAPLGRKRVLTPSPVAAAAEERGLPVLRTAKLDADATERILATGADLGVIVAYGGLVREPLLSGLAHGWINLHFSLLPRWRGAAPVQRALIAGDDLGWAVFQLVAALDAGDLYVQEGYLPAPNATAGDVLAHLAEVGGERLPEIVQSIADGADPVPQHGKETLAPKLTLEDGLLHPRRTAAEVFDRYRGVTPEPGAFVRVGGANLKLPVLAPAPDVDPIPAGSLTLVGKRVVLGTATEPIELVRVQPAGKAAMAAGDWWRGLRAERLEVDA